MTKQLEKRITEAAQAYYLGTNCMPDSEYDLLVDKLRKVDPNNKVLKSVGADISTTPWPIVTHRRPMGSLHKVNTEEDYRKWAIKYTSGIICVSEKLDGLSISLNYENGRLVQGVTRGDGEKGEDITVNLKLLKGAVTTLTGKYAKGRHEIRGEAILLTADYKKYFPRKELESGLVENANARNCAACIRRKHDNTDVKHVSFIAYDISSDSFNPVTKEEVFIEIKSLGFKVPFYKVGSIDKIWGIFEEYKNSKRAQIDYEIDGLVAEDDDREKFKEAGESSSRPKAARAIKFESETGQSVLRDIVWQVGRTGVVTPVAKIDPVVIGGVTVTSPSLMNVAECIRVGVNKDAIIMIERCNDVIPRLLECEGGTPFMLPTNVDGFKVCLKVEDEFIEYTKQVPVTAAGMKSLGINVDSVTSISLFCNDANHPMRKFRRMENFITQLDIKQVGEKAIQALIELGKLNELADYFKLTLSDWTEAVNSETNAKKIVQEFKKKTALVTLPVFIKSIGITFFGEDTSELIASKYPDVNTWFSLTVPQLVVIKGIGEAKAQAAVDGLKNHKKEIMELLKLIKTEVPEKENADAITVCFTGVRLPAEYAEAFKAKGYKEVSGVSKKTAILVMKDVNSGSAKADKARECGTKLVPLDEFIVALGGVYRGIR